MKLFDSIFEWLAKRFGYSLQTKDDTEIGYTLKGFNPTAIGAEVVSNITIDDSDIIVDGNGARAEAIKAEADYYSNSKRFAACSVALGTGDCLIRPFTDGVHLDYSIIPNNNFAVLNSVGNTLKTVAIRLDSYEGDRTDVYELFEAQNLKEFDNQNVVEISRFAYKNGKLIDIQTTNWKDMPTFDVIVSDQLLFGRIKCPTVNRDNPNAVEGVPITYGCETIVKDIRNRYAQYNEEFENKKVKVFADKTLFKVEERNGEKIKRIDDANAFEMVRGRGVDGGRIDDLISTYSPEIRESAMQTGANFDLAILELCCGFSRGVFTAPETAFATATEMKNSLKKTFSFVKKFRGYIEEGEKQLFNAVNVIMNRNEITPMGDYSLSFNWSYDYVEETRERFAQLLQMHSIDAVSRAEVRAWGMNEDLDIAEQKITEIDGAMNNDDEIEVDEDGIATIERELVDEPTE